jgi:hypothetical protein
MRDWASSGGVKIDRAIEHLNYLEREITAFKDRGAYSVVRDDDPQTGDLVFKVRVSEELPLRWGAIAGDALHNLRSALDILWRQMMFPRGGGEANRKCAFLIYDSAEEFKRSNSRKVHGPHQAAVQVYRALKPYKGGNDTLWLLGALDDADKHRLLLPVGLAIMRSVLSVRAGPDLEMMEEIASIEFIEDTIRANYLRYPLYDDTELWRIDARARNKVDVEPDFTFDISFGDPRIIERKTMPIIPTLSELGREVQGVVKAFTLAKLLT